jgi:8-oxo-dGTP diphosphatase
MTDRPIEFIARGLLSEGSRVLLCRNMSGGYYYLPGGHVEFGEPAAAAAEREFMEEGGVSVRAGQCLLVHENAFTARGKRHHEVNVVFHVEREENGEIRSQEPDLELEWVDLAALVDLDLRPEAIKAWLVSGGTDSCAWASTMA